MSTMSADDRRLLRRVLEWARANGWEPDPPNQRLRFGRVWGWRQPARSARILLIKTLGRDDPQLILDGDGAGVELEAVVCRADYAVNLLASCGWVPDSLSQLWERGRAAERDDEANAMPRASAEAGDA